MTNLTAETIERARTLLKAHWHGFIADCPADAVCDMALSSLSPAADVERNRVIEEIAASMLEQAAHFTDNAQQLRQWPFEADEARCREIAALFLSECAQTLRLDKKIADLNTLVDTVAKRDAEIRASLKSPQVIPEGSEDCGHCDGTGMLDTGQGAAGMGVIPCPACHGTKRTAPAPLTPAVDAMREAAAWLCDIAAYADHRPSRCVVLQKSDLSQHIPRDKITWTPLYE